MLGGIITALGSLAKTWVESRAKRSETKAEADAKVRMAAATSVAEWERLQALGAAKSWKDEAWTLTFIAIMLACFVPPAQPYVREGFAMLSETPIWFQTSVGASIAASFGIRALAKRNGVH